MDLNEIKKAIGEGMTIVIDKQEFNIKYKAEEIFDSLKVKLSPDASYDDKYNNTIEFMKLGLKNGDNSLSDEEIDLLLAFNFAEFTKEISIATKQAKRSDYESLEKPKN